MKICSRRPCHAVSAKAELNGFCLAQNPLALGEVRLVNAESLERLPVLLRDEEKARDSSHDKAGMGERQRASHRIGNHDVVRLQPRIAWQASL